MNEFENMKSIADAIELYIKIKSNRFSFSKIESSEIYINIFLEELISSSIHVIVRNDRHVWFSYKDKASWSNPKMFIILDKMLDDMMRIHDNKIANIVKIVSNADEV